MGNPPGQVRRMHRKSRTGCAECKRRHIKCDEMKPTCSHCSVSGRSCNYIRSAPSPAAASTPAPALVPSAPPVSLKPDGVSQQVPEVLSGHYYTNEHFTLFNHIVTRMDDLFSVTDTMQPLVQIYVRTALKSPYVMHELLAIAALHMRHQQPSRLEHYWLVAKELQNQGFSLFINSNSEELDPQDQFVFCSLVSVHVLVDELTFLGQRGLTNFIDGFSEYIKIYHGARILGTSSWEKLRDSELTNWFLAVEEQSAMDKSYISRNQESITAMLEGSQLGATAIEICTAAAEKLDFVRRRLHSRNSWGPHAPMAWINLVSEEYVRLLKNQIPEAMVILAHFAELLHQCRDFWIFHGSGEYMIRAIVANLGSTWNQWLTIPLESLGDHEVLPDV
ncbi:hypothetical protein F4806DRAFT_481632 [Annulohypoxylon nitens]|nr:hypothetical protein F4806DRAFT_481632 [Annulohypoxylon nitens]